MNRQATSVAAVFAVLLVFGAAARGQANFHEAFDNNGPNNGQDGPANLIAKGWIFRNQSQPEGSQGWFDGYIGFGWPSPQAGSGYLAVDSLSTDYFGGDVSTWAILPAVPGQAAGDVLTFYAIDMGGSNVNTLQVRYSPSGGTGTGSGVNGVGDFTTLLLDVNPIPVGGWNKYTATLPGSGRIALRYFIADACNFACFASYTGIDSLSVGPEPPPPCNMPPVPAVGETVTWTVAGGPYEVCENIGIPPGSTVVVESGVEVAFDEGTQLVVNGTLLVESSAQSRAVFTQSGTFPPMIVARQGVVDAAHGEFRGQFRVESGASVSLESCVFPAGAVLWAQELQAVAPHVVLDSCVFEGASAVLSDALVELRGNAFTDSFCQVLRGYAVLGAGNIFVGGPLAIIREETTQPFYVDGVAASGVNSAGGLLLDGGNFLLGQGVSLSGNLYPLTLSGGLLPGSEVPTAGNAINVIDVGRGSFRGPGRWPDFGIPYRITDPTASVGGDLTIDPGVVVESVGGGGLVFQSTRRLTAEGLPDAPITFRAVVPQQPWQGITFHVNSTEGPRLEHCIVENASLGVISTDNHLYVDSTIFRNNQVGANTNTFGSIAFRKTRFLSNAVGVSTTDLGSPILASPTAPNSFSGNGAAVNAFEFGVQADARHAWWGHPSGPQHPANPGGQGDAVVGPGASGVMVIPFLSAEPDFGDTPPVVRLVDPGPSWRTTEPSTDHLLETGSTFIVRWEASDDGAIVSQRIEFSPDGHYQSRFFVLADGIPADARSWEVTVPDPGFAVTNQPQFLRVVAVDDSGQEAWDQMPVVVPSNRLSGDVEIVTNLSGMTFHAGEAIPDVHWTGSVNDFPSILPFIVLESDGSVIQGLNVGGVGMFFGGFPHLSTDRARLAIRAKNNSNDVVWFFAEGYFSIRHDPRLGLEPPTVEVQSPPDGSAFAGGTAVPVRWIASDDEALVGFDVWASYDGGRTFHAVAYDLPGAARAFDWRLPQSAGIADVRVRVVAHDLRFQNSADEAAFAVLPSEGCAADFNSDGTVNTLDVLAFLNAFASGDPSADFNGDGTVNTLDVLAFLNAYAVGC